MKGHDKKTYIYLYLNYWDVNNLYGWAMLQSCLCKVLSGLKMYHNLVKILWKTVMKIVMKDILLKLMFNILKKYPSFTMICPFLCEIMKIEKVEKLVANLQDKKGYVIQISNLKEALIHRLVLKQSA